MQEKTKPLDAFIGFAPVFKNNFHEGNIISADLAVNDSLKGETALRSATSEGRKFNELIYTQKEISSIVSLFARNNLQAKGYLFAEASEENFKKQSGKYKYVHIASTVSAMIKNSVFQVLLFINQNRIHRN